MTRTGFDPQLAALAAALPLRRLGHARLRRVAAARRTGSRSRLWPTRSPALIDALGETRGARRRALDGRADRAPHRAAPSRARALARPARLEPGVRARRHRSRGLEAAAPRRARRRADAGEHGRARAALDHGAGRRRRRGRRGGRVDGAHLGRRAARRGRVPAHARRARRASARSRAPTLVLVGEHDEETPLVVRRGARARHPRRGAARSSPAPATSRTSRRRTPSTPRCAPTSKPSRPRDDRVALDRRLRAPPAPLRAQPRRGRRGALGVGQPPRARRDARLAAQMLGGRVYDVVVPTPAEHRAGGAALDRRVGRAGRQPAARSRASRPRAS